MSDSVDSAILKNMHVTKNPEIIGKDWNDFEAAAKDKKLILYGLNGLLNFLWMRCDKKFPIIAAIDNDPEKQKHTLSELFDESDLEDAGNIKVSSKEILKDYKANEVVVLISGFRYIEEITKELEETGFNCYFSVLHLEYNYREHMNKNHIHYEDRIEYLHHYAEKCAKEYPIQSNKAIFSMTTYAEHGKYITEQLLLMNKNIDIVWVVNNQNFQVPEGFHPKVSGLYQVQSPSNSFMKWKQPRSGFMVCLLHRILQSEKTKFISKPNTEEILLLKRASWQI